MRGRPTLIIGGEVDTVVIVVVEGVGFVTASLLHLSSSSRRPPWGLLILDRRRNCLVRLWMW